MFKSKIFRSGTTFFISLIFSINYFTYPYAIAGDVFLPAPGVMVPLSPEFNPPILKGIKIHPGDPFRFDFILDQGDSKLSNDQVRQESSRLIKYFLASLTVPEKDLWVNLSPYEKNRIVPESFGQTGMGRDLLAEDYMLKQITASLIYPEDEIGKKFWKRIYEEAYKKFGTTNIPVNTFNKVWIVPEKAVVYENAKAGTAYVVESKLKVMLEQDYLSLEKHQGQPGDIASAVSQVNPDSTNELGSQIVREIVIPELTKEVNEDKNFSQLREVYNSLILATWYKKKIQDSILSQVYADKNKIAGVNIDDPEEKERIYQRYLQAFKKGVYNYIKEDIDPVTQAMTPRKYFSGGTSLYLDGVLQESENSAMVTPEMDVKGHDTIVKVVLNQAVSTTVVEDHIALFPDNNDTKIVMVIPANLISNPETSALIERIKSTGEDFAMSNDGKGHLRLTFKIREAVANIRASLNFMPWERHASRFLIGATIILTPVAFFYKVPERIVETVDTILLSVLVIKEFSGGQAKNFMAYHEYYYKVLKGFYEKGKFKNGHTSKEVLSFYRSNYMEFVDNLDDDQELQTLILLAGTLAADGVDALKKNKKGTFEHRLEWALDEFAKRKEEFIKVHDAYLNQLMEADKDKRKVPSKVITKALKFYNQNSQDFQIFLTQQQRDKIAELIATRLSTAEKNRISTVPPKQRTAIEELMYWDLEAETAEESPQSPDAGNKSPAMSSQIRREGGIDLEAIENSLQIQNGNGEIKFRLDPEQFLQLQNAPGFYPMVISVEPLNNLQQFLGITDSQIAH